MTPRIDIFLYILSKLEDWYCEYYNISHENFNDQNDFSILKLIKLDFFVSAIDSKSNPILLKESKYYAMPYGPVETSVYDALRNNHIDNFLFSRYSLFKNTNLIPKIPQEIQSAIEQSIEILKKNEYSLIAYNAGTLVDLTHKWHSWKKNYSLAKSLGLFSIEIPIEDIVNDIKFIKTSQF